MEGGDLEIIRLCVYTDAVAPGSINVLVAARPIGASSRGACGNGNGTGAGNRAAADLDEMRFAVRGWRDRADIGRRVGRIAIAKTVVAVPRAGLRDRPCMKTRPVLLGAGRFLEQNGGRGWVGGQVGIGYPGQLRRDCPSTFQGGARPVREVDREHSARAGPPILGRECVASWRTVGAKVAARAAVVGAAGRVANCPASGTGGQGGKHEGCQYETK